MLVETKQVLHLMKRIFSLFKFPKMYIFYQKKKIKELSIILLFYLTSEIQLM